MDRAEAHAGEVGLLAVRLLEPQRKQDRGAGRLAGQKATVAGPVDDATARLRRQPLHLPPFMPILGTVVGQQQQLGAGHTLTEHIQEPLRLPVNPVQVFKD
jgi:hypothetical protein